MKRLLVDHTGVVEWQLTEDEQSGKLIMRGEFARSDHPTANGRIYSRSLWEREINRLRPKIEQRSIMGELDHPMSGKSSLDRASHLITNLYIDDNGRVIGEAEIMDTEKGKTLMGLFKSRAAVGVSSRGFGSTTPVSEGKEMVNEDYLLNTFDAVADPADQDAYPEVFTEDNKTKPVKETVMNIKELKVKYPDLVEQIEKDIRNGLSESIIDERVKSRLEAMKEDFTKQMQESLVDVRENLQEEVRGQLLSDPDVAYAKVALDQIKSILAPALVPADAEEVVQERDERIESLRARITELEEEYAQLKEDHEELAGVSRKVGHQLYIEQTLKGDAEEDLIRAQLRDIEFENLKDVDDKIEAIRESLTKVREEQAERNAHLDEIKEENEALRQALKDSEVALRKSLEAGKMLGIGSYVERQLSGHPHAPRLRKMMESCAFTTQAEVDEFISDYSDKHTVSEDFDHVRNRMARATRRRKPISVINEDGTDDIGENEEDDQDNGTINESKKADSGQVVTDVLGTPISELRRLSGIKN